MSDLLALLPVDFWPRVAVFGIGLACASYLAYLLISALGGNPLHLPLAAIAGAAHLCVIVAIVVAMYLRLMSELLRLPLHLWRDRRKQLPRRAPGELSSTQIIAALQRRSAP